MEYTMLDDLVNVVQRLRARADGGALCSGMSP